MEPQDYPPILLLPTEILLEILSYHHTTPVPYERWRLAGDILFGRFAVLRALSQTCRTFRNIFLPLVWENVEAVDDDRRGRHILVLKRRMMGILKTPSLPRCVRTLLVSLTLSAPNWNLFTVFARFIQATPNLSGLHIVDVSQRHAGALSGALLSQSFPSICELTIPALLARSLSAFPNIQLLICADSYAVDYDAIALLKSARQYCPLLKSIMNFTPSLPVIHFIVKHFPCVENLQFHHVVTPDVLAPLRSLQTLQTIHFPHRYPQRIDVSPCQPAHASGSLVRADDEKLALIVDAGKAIFRTVRDDGPPVRVWVQYLPPEADVGDVIVRVGVARP